MSGFRPPTVPYWAAFLLAGPWLVSVAAAQGRYATSDNQSGYVHWIELYDANNRRIDPSAENPPPYSPAKTCGRCHEFDTIAHGWHFNAVDEGAFHGRPGQPLIWSDERTGTHLPLSYRGWQGTFHPEELGLTRWQVAAKLGGFLPGGGIGSAESLAADQQLRAAAESDSEAAADEDEEIVDRSSVTGELLVDCMMCHRNAGSGYSPFVYSEQIEDENFPYAPTAALGLGTVSGSMTRLKDDFDPTAEDAAGKLPKLVYESSKFRSDGKVFFDLVRKPKNDACYYCHTSVSADSVQGTRWLHDEDVHLRAGMACADCHRNGLDHHTVRGYPGEIHAAGRQIASLSCQGCHIGTAPDLEANILGASGRLGAPKPAHRGIPPLHFSKLSCTACHSGPLPSESLERQIHSIAHHLGAHVKRTGEEAPGIVAAVNLPVDILAWQSRPTATAQEETEIPEAEATTELVYTPHRLMWPSFWATLRDGELQVLSPEQAYDVIRRPLKVRRSFTEELAEVKLSLSTRKELLGEERARVKPEETTEAEQRIIAEAEAEQRATQIGEQMSAALAALEEEFPGTQAVFVSGGQAFARKDDVSIEQVDTEALANAAAPYQWPIAHNVRPARQALGAESCLECHHDESLFFQTEIQPVGVLPDQQTVAIKAFDLQQPDMVRLSTWNQLFAGRASFKIAGLVVLLLTCLVVVSAMAWNLGSWFRRSSE